MKRMALFVLFAFSFSAVTFAHGGEWGQRGPGFFRQQQAPNAENMTVTGNLSIVQGMIAVKSGDITYYVRGLHRFIGFIDGLKEGARVTLEGSGITSPNDAKSKLLHVTKLTLNGKEFELGTPVSSNAPNGARQGPGRHDGPPFPRMW